MQLITLVTAIPMVGMGVNGMAPAYEYQRAEKWKTLGVLATIGLGLSSVLTLGGWALSRGRR